MLRQRNALLSQSGGRLTPEIEVTLDVWDAKLDRGRARPWPTSGWRCSTGCAPGWRRPTTEVARRARPRSTATYGRPWRDAGLAEALAAARGDDLRRGVTPVGPHRDDLELAIAGLPARTHASQGEQRSLALALRLAAHAVVTEAAGSPPVLLLDDVFSELDPGRSRALVDTCRRVRPCSPRRPVFRPTPIPTRWYGSRTGRRSISSPSPSAQREAGRGTVNTAVRAAATRSTAPGRPIVHGM